MVILHYIVRFSHPELFIKRHGVLVCDQIDRDILFSACEFVRGFHQPFADPLTLIASVYAESVINNQ